MKYKNKTKNNKNNSITTEVNRHYSIRKFSVGVASVLIGTTLFLGSQGQKVQADDKPAVTEESNSELPSDKDNLDSESNTSSGKAQTSAVTSNEKKDNNATNISVDNKPTNEQVSASAQDDVAQEELTGDTNASGNRDSQKTHKATSLNTDSNKFELTSTITNNTDHDDKNIFAVTILPNTKDGKSEFDTHLTGPVEVEGEDNAENVINWYVTGDVGKSLDTLLTKDSNGNYEPTKAALNSAVVQGDFKLNKKWKQDDWDKVTAVITTVDSLKSKSSLKIHLHTYDPSVETDVGKDAYMSQAVMDSTSFKKLRLGRTVNYVSVDGKALGSSDPQNINDIAIYHTNAITGDIVGDIVLEKGLPKYDLPTFDGYKFYNISGGNTKFWKDYDPENPTKILPVRVIKNLQDAKVSTRSGYASIPRDTITVTYRSNDPTTNIQGSGVNTLALFSMLSAAPQTPDKVEEHVSIINAGDSNSAKLTVVGKQKINISYIDDTEGKQLGQTDSVEGLPGETAAYSTADRINEYKKQGYGLVSDGTKTSDNQSTLIYDNDYQTDQNFEVHLKHVYTTPEITVRHATWTINYVGSDHNPESKQQEVTFTRTVYTDKVTNEVNDSGYVPDKQFKNVKSPEVDGYSIYKPDENAVVHQDTKLGENDSDANYVTIVPYLKDQPGTDLPDPMESRQSTWTIHYVGLDKNPDDVVQTVHFIKKGDKFVPTANFKDIASPKVDGYDVDIKTAHQDTVLGEDNTDGKFETTVIYTKPSQFVDTDTPVESHRATLTINYVGTDNNPKSVVQTVYFVKKGDQFVPTSNFEDVVSPEINGYNLYNPDEFAKVHQDTKLGKNDSDIDYVIDVPYVKDEPGADLPDPMESRQSTWTIHYVGLDKNPDDVVQTVYFTKQGDKFVPTANFKDIASPKVDGYDVDIATAHQDTVLGEDNTDGNFETTVIYTKPNEFVDVPAKIADKKGIPGEPLVQDKLPAFTGGVPGIPLEQPELPKFEGGIPGIPLEQPDKPIAKIGIPGEPLEQPNKPIAEIDVPGEPLEQPDLPIAPTPDTNIPDIPNPKIPEKQVPQKPTLSNPTPDPDPTPEVPVSNEDTSVKSGNITSDSFVSARTNSSKVVPKKYRNTEKLLPQTGKKNSVALSILGLATLSLTGLIVLATTKKKRRY